MLPVLVLSRPPSRDCHSAGAPCDTCATGTHSSPRAHRREGDDLVMTKRITLAEALCGVQFSVQTLDGRTLQINTQDQIIQPGSHKSIA